MPEEFSQKLYSSKTGKKEFAFPRPNFIPADDEPIKIETKPQNLDSFEAAAAEQAEAYTYEDYLVDLYMKVGLFCHWSWNQFEDTPTWAVQKINSRIDKKIEEEQIINYDHLILLLVLSKAFGGK